MASDCIEWDRACTRAGYGVTTIRRKTKYVHRLAMEQSIGRVLRTDEVVMHTCDNPTCYNIDHLRLGTHKENIHDMISKGRRGECGRRLTDDDVANIRRLRSEGVRCCDVATMYGVHQSTISKITSGSRRVEQGV